MILKELLFLSLFCFVCLLFVSQVAHLVDGNRSFIISHGKTLLLLSLKERSASESAKLLEDVDDSNVLHEFQTEGMVGWIKRGMTLAHS